MSLQKVSGWLAMAWLPLGLASLAVIMLRQKAGVSDPLDGAQMLRFMLDDPWGYKWSPLLGAIAGGLFIVIVLGVQARLENATPAWARLAGAFGILAGGFFLLSGLLGLTNGEMLTQAYPQNAHAAEAAYLPTLVVADAAGVAGLVAMGLWLGFVSGAGLRSAQLPKGFCYLGLVCGGLFTGAMANLLLGVVGSLLAFIAMSWLGVILVRR